MSAFYEWKKDGAKKIPSRIFLPDEEIFFVHALILLDKERNICSSLITTTPNDFIKPIHHRMPIIFKVGEGIKYLSDSLESNMLKCIPYQGKMSMAKFQFCLSLLWMALNLFLYQNFFHRL